MIDTIVYISYNINMTENTRRRRWSRNTEKAAEKMREQGLPVDLDDLGQEAERAMVGFYQIDPDVLREAGDVALREGMIDEEEYKKLIEDANEIERERESRETSSE